MVIDTNVFIDFLRARDKTKTALFRIRDDEQLFISSVTLYELLIGATTPEKVSDISLLTTGVSLLPFNEDVARKAAEIYHRLRTENNMIDFRDIFIAATCMIYDHSLKTLNKKHFDRITGLRIN